MKASGMSLQSLNVDQLQKISKTFRMVRELLPRTTPGNMKLMMLAPQLKQVTSDLSSDEISAAASLLAEVAADTPELAGPTSETLARILEDRALTSSDVGHVSRMVRDLDFDVVHAVLDSAVEALDTEVVQRRVESQTAATDSGTQHDAEFYQQHRDDPAEWAEPVPEPGDTPAAAALTGLDPARTHDLEYSQTRPSSASGYDLDADVTSTLPSSAADTGDVARLARESYREPSPDQPQKTESAPEPDTRSNLDSSSSVWERFEHLRARSSAERISPEEIQALVEGFPAGWQRREAVSFLVGEGLLAVSDAREVAGLGPSGSRFLS